MSSQHSWSNTQRPSLFALVSQTNHVTSSLNVFLFYLYNLICASFATRCPAPQKQCTSMAGTVSPLDSIPEVLSQFKHLYIKNAPERGVLSTRVVFLYLATVIHFKLNRMRCLAKRSDLFHLKRNVCVDSIISKYATCC